jgi:ankyrin repeat protein
MLRFVLFGTFRWPSLSECAEYGRFGYDVPDLDGQLQGWREADDGNKPLVMGHFTQLHNCSRLRDLSCVKEFKNKREYWDVRDEEGLVPLIYAIGREHGQTLSETECAMELISWGVDVNARNCFGLTPMIWAAFYNRPEVIHALALRGASVDEAGEPDGTVRPLGEAVSMRALGAIKALLDLGADPRLVKGRSWTISTLISQCPKSVGADDSRRRQIDDCHEIRRLVQARLDELAGENAA